MSADLTFEELRTERQALRNAVLGHADSVLFFREKDKPWFRRQAHTSEDDPPHPEKPVRHLTTTASCLESLADVSHHQDDDGRVSDSLSEIARDFADAALGAGDDAWESEGSAQIYCRVRTLPAILRFAPDDVLKKHADRLAQHVSYVWSRADPTDPERQGVAEYAPPDSARVDGDQGPTAAQGQPLDTPALAPSASQPPTPGRGRRGYPPNAFHTYWALKLIRAYDHRGTLLPKLDGDLALKKAVAELWARRTLATQTALIEASRLRVDAHQLAWALATDVIANGDRAVRPESEHDELYEAALDAFFSEQSEDGSWRLYEPLFHYFQAGNAYCYTFETLAELLRPALRTKDGRVWRDRLRPYASKLLNAWHYAASTAIETDAGRRGWCSGHHPHRTDPEAWATAGVFSYLENLRCLVGHWAAEKAQETLRVQRPRWATPELARAELADRGETWPVLDKPTAGRQLASMFLHPLEATRSVQDTIDPDQPLVMEARSAVLFGPPGGSKTTMVEALAGALDWRYVEVHASHFLSRGMDLVPSRADEIFSRLMELDRCVILFDEIDELIRMRQDSGSDPFGRFLTTSMLPKLARLWEQQRVLFFVATNAIDAADAAIKRSQRFDASIFVTPPAFGKKVSELTERLGSEPPSALTEAAVQEALDAPSGMSGHPLGVFALLRWDQIAELAHGLRVELQSGLATDAASADQALEKVLAVMGDKLAELEWRIEAKPEGAGESPKDPFALFAHYAAAERLDYRNRAMLRICGQPSPLPSGWKEFESDDRYIIITPEVEAALKRAGDAWELEGGSWHATDGGGLFSFALRSPTGAAHGSEASS